MLPRKLRLPFFHVQTVFKTGKIIQNDKIKLVWLIKNAGFPRFSIQVSKKVYKKAVERNRSKRIISEALGCLVPHLKQPVDGLVIVKKPLEEYKTQDVKVVLRGLFTGTGLRI